MDRNVTFIQYTCMGCAANLLTFRLAWILPKLYVYIIVADKSLKLLQFCVLGTTTVLKARVI